jgi:CRP-like cAMP-binding protein
MNCPRCKSINSIFIDYEKDRFCIQCGWREVIESPFNDDLISSYDSIERIMKILRKKKRLQLKELLTLDGINTKAGLSYLRLLARHKIIGTDGKSVFLQPGIGAYDFIKFLINYLSFTTIRELGAYSGYSKTHIIRILNSLEKQGIVQKQKQRLGNIVIWEIVKDEDVEAFSFLR